MKRRGFTLIELMVVIAIIIILAAIAIPNYLKMTERAKKSRLQSDFATLATVLETFKTDWGKYPVVASPEAVSVNDTNVYMELAGTDHGSPGLNVASATNAIGETNPAAWSAATPFIEYIKSGTLDSMVNAFNTADDHRVLYGSADGDNWVLYVNTDLPTNPIMSRTDGQSTPVFTASTPAIP